jgi:hypothetical protein
MLRQSKLPVLKTIDAHSVLNRKVSRASLACDAADVLDGLATLQNPTIRMVAVAFGVSVASVSERNGMPAIDDPLPGERDNVFRRVKQMLFAAPPGAHPGSNRMKQ